jgi:hypothetical protein
MDTRTDINGLPAKYVLAKNPHDPTGESYVIAKVLEVPDVSETTHPNPIRIPSSYISYNFSETPLNLCDPSKFITQYRRGDPNLSHRTIDISKQTHTQEEISWYADLKPVIPEPKRLVMIARLRCYLCGDFQKTDDDIYYEGVGQHTFGYRYCTECRPYFLDSLYKAIAPVAEFRHRYEAWLSSEDSTIPKPFIWVARTRRDENGRRIVGGNAPYKYRKWRIINWVAQKLEFPRISPEDNITIIREEEMSLLCEQIEENEDTDFALMSIIKSVPLRDIYITNLGLLGDTTDPADPADPSKPEYDPNVDDPLNKYSDKEQREMFKSATNES